MHYSVYNSSEDHFEGGWTNGFSVKRITGKSAGKTITMLLIVCSFKQDNSLLLHADISLTASWRTTISLRPSVRRPSVHTILRSEDASPIQALSLAVSRPQVQLLSLIVIT